MAYAAEVKIGQTRGETREEISRAFVQLLKEHGGKGPKKTRTYVEDDLVFVVMRGGYTRAEQTLFEDGKWQTCGRCATPSRTRWRPSSPR